MYISKVVIENYRCFGSKTEIKLKPGVNVFIGENNSGKTTVLNALGFLFGRIGTDINIPQNSPTAAAPSGSQHFANHR